MPRVLPPPKTVTEADKLAFDVALSTLDPETRKHIAFILQVGAAASKALVTGPGHIYPGAQEDHQRYARDLYAQIGAQLGVVEPNTQAAVEGVSYHLANLPVLIGGLTLPDRLL